mmetsp:Transcript_17929/g.33873  ORF Transcript_17929/g.33873 Transcript_17929/m.33873 type:complete len:92 (+) Transcript_17929:138-413(+)
MYVVCVPCLVTSPTNQESIKQGRPLSYHNDSPALFYISHQNLFHSFRTLPLKESQHNNKKKKSEEANRAKKKVFVSSSAQQQKHRVSFGSE